MLKQKPLQGVSAFSCIAVARGYFLEMHASLANQSLSLLAFNRFDLSFTELEVLLRSQQYDRYVTVHLVFVDGVEPLLDVVKGLL